jgi:hypothetical protein
MFPIFILTTYESIRDTTFIFHGQLHDTNFDLNFCWLSVNVLVPVGEAPPPPDLSRSVDKDENWHHERPMEGVR